MAKMIIVLATVAVIVTWGYSVVEPRSFGSCSTVALRFGKSPTATDCQAYGPEDFLVPLIAIVILGLILGDDDFEISFGPFGKFTRKRAAKKAADDLESAELDRRGQEFLQSLERGGQS